MLTLRCASRRQRDGKYCTGFLCLVTLLDFEDENIALCFVAKERITKDKIR
ncbi:hypothetical protein J6590_028539 [Homalodisca vitripennis]|nr:hypothetical protein J6590_028539 [Homalodisca vitripennis]